MSQTRQHPSRRHRNRRRPRSLGKHRLLSKHRLLEKHRHRSSRITLPRKTPIPFRPLPLRLCPILCPALLQGRLSTQASTGFRRRNPRRFTRSFLPRSLPQPTCSSLPRNPRRSQRAVIRRPSSPRRHPRHLLLHLLSARGIGTCGPSKAAGLRR